MICIEMKYLLRTIFIYIGVSTRVLASPTVFLCCTTVVLPAKCNNMPKYLAVNVVNLRNGTLLFTTRLTYFLVEIKYSRLDIMGLNCF